jgi:archaellum component FlaC|tara:strand:- start:106 stop:366 length:261 start_codon:yes stop_codon:yes gene_type:complete
MIFEIFLGVLLVIEGYIIWNLFRKTELLETWVEDFTQRIQTVQNDLNEIDSSGAFESDDEVGTIFEQIKETVKQLENLKGEEVDAS